MAAPVLRGVDFDRTSFAPGETVTGVVDAYDRDNQIGRLRTTVGGSTVVTVLEVGDPLPAPVHEWVDGNGAPVAAPEGWSVAVDPLDAFVVRVTAADLPD